MLISWRSCLPIGLLGLLETMTHAMRFFVVVPFCTYDLSVPCKHTKKIYPKSLFLSPNNCVGSSSVDPEAGETTYKFYKLNVQKETQPQVMDIFLWTIKNYNQQNIRFLYFRVPKYLTLTLGFLNTEHNKNILRQFRDQTNWG